MICGRRSGVIRYDLSRILAGSTMIRRLSRVGGWSIPALLATMALAFDVWAGGVAVLKSGELPSYNQAKEGAVAALPPSTTVVEYTLSEHISEARRIGQVVRASRPDLVIAIGLRAAVAAKLELPDVRTIFCLVLFPEHSGLPTENMIGIAMHPSAEYQLDNIRSIAPNAKRIGLIHGPAISARFLSDANQQARLRGLSLFTVGASDAHKVPAAVKQLPTINMLWILPDPLVVTAESMEFLLAYSFESHIPLFAFSPSLVQHGAVGASYLDPREVGLQAGREASRLLQPNRRSTLGTVLPAEQPHLAVNVRSAEHFGLSLSLSTLQAARARFGTGGLAQSYAPPDSP